MSEQVKVYGLPNCQKCESAKDKLRRFGIEYEEKSYKDFVTPHPGWRDDESVQIVAARSFFGTSHVPLIKRNGSVHDYPGFMKWLKQQQPKDNNGRTESTKTTACKDAICSET